MGQYPLVQAENCYFCGHQEFQEWLCGIRDRLGIAEGEWAFNTCTHCGSVILSPHPDERDLPSYYPETYCFEPYAKKENAFTEWVSRLEYSLFYKPIHRARARRILKIIGEKYSAPTLLDLGCGSGLLLTELQRLGMIVEVAEIRQSAVDSVEHMFNIKCHLMNPDAEAFGLPQERYDIVTIFHALEHTTDPKRTIQQVSKLLKPEGMLVIAVPIMESFMLRCMKQHSITLTEAPRHVSIPSITGMKQLLQKSGFHYRGIYSDSILSDAGCWTLSFIPLSSTAFSGYLMKKLSRIMSFFMVLLFILIVFVENYILKVPITAIFAFSPVSKARS